MTASSASTAEPTRVRARAGSGRRAAPRVRPAVPAAPVSVAPISVPAQPVQGRAECQAARRLERRQRRLVGALGLAVIGLMLLLTVVVLDVLH